MSFDHEHDWLAFVKKTEAEHHHAQRADLTSIAQAVPAMEALTGQPDWDVFLSLLQARIEKTQTELQELERADLDSPEMSTEVLVVSKTRRLVLRGRIATLEEVLKLPKTLMEDGREAAKRLLKGVQGADA